MQPPKGGSYDDDTSLSQERLILYGVIYVSHNHVCAPLRVRVCTVYTRTVRACVRACMVYGPWSRWQVSRDKRPWGLKAVFVRWQQGSHDSTALFRVCLSFAGDEAVFPHVAVEAGWGVRVFAGHGFHVKGIDAFLYGNLNISFVVVKQHHLQHKHGRQMQGERGATMVRASGTMHTHQGTATATPSSMRQSTTVHQHCSGSACANLGRQSLGVVQQFPACLLASTQANAQQANAQQST